MNPGLFVPVLETLPHRKEAWFNEEINEDLQTHS